MNEPRIGVIIVSAGESQRMCGLDKIFTPVLGKPILSYSISAFSMFSIITEIVIVLSKSNLNQGKQLLENGNWGGGLRCA
jgi:2-C-methyl-D-erythritol 4-phosphate cytidylyltransferase